MHCLQHRLPSAEGIILEVHYAEAEMLLTHNNQPIRFPFSGYHNSSILTTSKNNKHRLQPADKTSLLLPHSIFTYILSLFPLLKLRNEN